MRNRKRLKKAEIVLGCALCFYLLSMPFRWLFTLNAVTEVRPASALPPVFGLLWGGWGALGAAVGNLIADLHSGYRLGIVAVGAVWQFLYGYVPHLLWKYLPWRGKRKLNVPRMDSTFHILRYLLIDLFNTLCMSLALGLTMEAFRIGKLWSLATLATLLNNLVFTIILGIPLLILWGLYQDRRLSLNARVALFCVMQGVLAAVMVGFSSYHGASIREDSALLLWNRVFFSSFAAFIVFFGISIFFLRYMEQQVTIPAEKLAQAARIYMAQEKQAPDYQAFTATCEPFCALTSEMGTLARSSRQMVLQLQEYMKHLQQVTADRERINTELNVAKQIQTGMLPCVLPPFPQRSEFLLHAAMEPAREVGGDFYDFFLTDDDHLVLTIADVSGKGVPAALFMVISQTLLRISAHHSFSPADILTQVNRQLCRNNEAEMFVTVWLGILELSTGRLTCANAGHEYPAVSRAGEDFALLKDRHGFVLAGMENSRYQEYTLELMPGDRIFVYTDGVTEAVGEDRQQFGADRLLRALNQEKSAPPEQLLRMVRDDLNAFTGEADQFDDITMLGITYLGRGERK